MSRMEEMDRILKHVWCEPKFVAQVEWWDHPDHLNNQIFRDQWPRAEQEHYVRTGKHINPDRELALRPPPEDIDFDWWEPRHDAPWRRQDARDRGESA